MSKKLTTDELSKIFSDLSKKIDIALSRYGTVPDTTLNNALQNINIEESTTLLINSNTKSKGNQK